MRSPASPRAGVRDAVDVEARRPALGRRPRQVEPAATMADGVSASPTTVTVDGAGSRSRRAAGRRSRSGRPWRRSRRPAPRPARAGTAPRAGPASAGSRPERARPRRRARPTSRSPSRTGWMVQPIGAAWSPRSAALVDEARGVLPVDVGDHHVGAAVGAARGRRRRPLRVAEAKRVGHHDERDADDHGDRRGDVPAGVGAQRRQQDRPHRSPRSVATSSSARRIGQVGADLAVGDDQHVVGVRRGVEVVGHHDDGLAELAHAAAQVVEHLRRGRAVEVAGRLVGEDDVRLG